MNRMIQESMSTSDIADAQNEHYMLDDQLRKHTSKMTPAQKKKLVSAAADIVKGE